MVSSHSVIISKQQYVTSKLIDKEQAYFMGLLKNSDHTLYDALTATPEYCSPEHKMDHCIVGFYVVNIWNCVLNVNKTPKSKVNEHYEFVDMVLYSGDLLID